MHNENLWSPWRYEYIQDLKRRQEVVGADGAVQSNFLLEYWESPDCDRENLVVMRSDDGLVLLNRYPYANGHLLVALGEARPTLLDYEPSQRRAFWDLIESAAEMMRSSLHPQGVNIGINEGRAAGAGLPEHLHAHLVPRWNGDTNFITAIGEVRVIPASLETMWEMYVGNR